MIDVYLGLGSNLDEPRQQLEQAIETLQENDKVNLLAVAPFYRSAPVGPPGQDHYINTAVHLTTLLSPFELLDLAQEIENKQKRVRKERWGPRTIDVDVLFYGDITLEHERLSLPHPRITERNFVIKPLVDLNPALRFPDGRLLTDILPIIGLAGLEAL